MDEKQFSLDSWQLGYITGQLQMLKNMRLNIADAVDELEESVEDFTLSNFLSIFDLKIDSEHLLLHKEAEKLSQDILQNPEKYGFTAEQIEEVKEFANSDSENARRGMSFTLIEGGKA